MALPGNDHYAHSDGYRSEKGSRNDERMMSELANEIEQHDAVTAVWPEQDVDGAYVEIECDVERTLDAIEDTLFTWDARVVRVDEQSGLVTVRPE